MKDVSVRSTGRWMRGVLALVALALLLASCQFVQNEFFFIDRAAPPPPPADGTTPTW